MIDINKLLFNNPMFFATYIVHLKQKHPLNTPVTLLLSFIWCQVYLLGNAVHGRLFKHYHNHKMNSQDR